MTAVRGRNFALLLVLFLFAAACGGGSAGTSEPATTGTGPGSTAVTTTTSATTSSSSAGATPSTSTTTTTTTVASAPAVELRWIGMRDASTGWAVAGPLARASGMASLLRTDDGGLTWRDVSPGPIGDAAPVVASFGDHVWFVEDGTAGVTVWHSPDGGTTWSSTTITIDPPFDATRLVFPDDRHGWLLVQRDGAAGTIFVDLYASTDAGATWSIVSTPPADEADAALQSGHSLDLDANPSGRVWVTKDLSAFEGAHVAASVDGGSTWRDIVIGGLESGFCATRSPYVRDAAFGAVTATCDDGTSWVATTPDDGQTWDLTPLPEEAVQVFWFEDGAFAWGDALLRGDPDGWKIVHRFAARPSAVSIPDAVHVFAVVEGRLLVSPDQGETWTEVVPTLGG